MTQFGVPPRKSGSKFFAQPGIPVSKMTRADIDASVAARERAIAERSREHASRKTELSRIYRAEKRAQENRRIAAEHLQSLAGKELEYLNKAAANYGVTVAEIVGYSSVHEVVRARINAIAMMRAAGFPWLTVAEVLNRNRKTCQDIFNQAKARNRRKHRLAQEGNGK